MRTWESIEAGDRVTVSTMHGREATLLGWESPYEARIDVDGCGPRTVGRDEVKLLRRRATYVRRVYLP